MHRSPGAGHAGEWIDCHDKSKAGYSDGLYDAIGGLLAIALERATALDRFSRVEAAREGERLRSALLDSVTHELRTPLTAIRAAATSLLSQPSLGESQRHEMFAILDEESARLDRLIGQAVEMAQLDTDGIEVRLKPQRLQEVIDMALEDCHALLRGRPVMVELPPDMPSISLDRELIRRVLRHLLENAARYSPAGSPVRIGAALEADRLLVSITDQGQGIDEAEQAYIFDKFYRGSRQRLLHGQVWAWPLPRRFCARTAVESTSSAIATRGRLLPFGFRSSATGLPDPKLLRSNRVHSITEVSAALTRAIFVTSVNPAFLFDVCASRRVSTSNLHSDVLRETLSLYEYCMRPNNVLSFDASNG